MDTIMITNKQHYKIGDWVYCKKHGYGIVVKQFFINVPLVFFISSNARLVCNNTTDLELINIEI